LPTLLNPASDLAAALTGQTLGSVALITGTNLFYTRIHPMPMGLVVQLLNSAGQAPMPLLGNGTSVYRASVQALVFGSPGEDGFVQGEALARGVAGYLHQLRPSGYVSLFVRDSSPTIQEPDPETQRHRWTISIEAVYIA
jgi:hypothetical protein